MVKIDENGDKVNVWTENRIDVTTFKLVEVEHRMVLATVDDIDHWRTRTILDSNESMKLDQPTLFVYGSESTLRSIEELMERVAEMCQSGTDCNEVNIPLSALLRVMVGETEIQGTLLYKAQIPAQILVLLASCDMASAEQLRDALFEIFPDVDYIEIYE